MCLSGSSWSGSASVPESSASTCVSHPVDILGGDSDIAVVPQTSWAEGVPVHHLVSPRDFSEDMHFGENARGRDTGKSSMKRFLRRMEAE